MSHRMVDVIKQLPHKTILLQHQGWPKKAKERPSCHEVRLALLDTNPVFPCLGHKCFNFLCTNYCTENDVLKRIIQVEDKME